MRGLRIFLNHSTSGRHVRPSVAFGNLVKGRTCLPGSGILSVGSFPLVGIELSRSRQNA